MEPGEPVLYRSIYGANVRWCFPHHFAGERDGASAIYCRPGNRGKVMGHEDDYLVRWAAGDPPRDHVWHSQHVLWLLRPGAGYALGVWWDLDWELARWYVNLQAPTRIRGRRFDTCDLALDVVVQTDGSWRWKDEDDLARAVELGILDEEEAAAVYAEGERVVAAQPWPTGWEDWRPPAEWEPLALPEDWHVV